MDKASRRESPYPYPPVMPPGYGYPGYGYPPPMDPRQAENPAARGKAAAFDTWLAQGGELVKKNGRGDKGKSSRFAQGPMRGMTYDQAKQKFERMWATAPDSVKNKYASRSLETDLAPVERPGGQAPTGNAANGPRPGETMPQYYQRIGMAPKPEQPAKAEPSPASEMADVPTFEELTAPVDQSKLSPDGMRHAIGSGEASAPIVPPQMPNAINGAPEEWKAYNAQMASLTPPSQPFLETPIGKLVAPIVDPDTINNTDAAVNRIDKGAPAPVVTPTAAAPPTLASPTESPAPRRYPSSPRGSVGGASATGQAGRISTGASPSAPVEVRNQVAANAGVPAVIPDQVAAPMPKPVAGSTGAASPVAKPVRINQATGLPFGYRPGDAVPAANQAKANESFSAQIAADPRMQPGGGMIAGPARTPITGQVMAPPPVQSPFAPNRPAPGRSDGYQARSPIESTRMQIDAERNARARQLAGPTQPNPAGLTLGARKPLDQLVADNPAPKAIPIEYPGRQQRPAAPTMTNRPVVRRPSFALAR